MSQNIPYHLTDFSDVDLARLRALVDIEAKRRGLRLDVGSIGERLIIDLFKGTRGLPVLVEAPRGTKNIDALSRDGERYSIKTLQSSKKTGTVYPDTLDKERQLFEYIVVAMLAPDFTLHRAVLFTWKQFCSARSWDTRMGAWYLARSERAFAFGSELPVRAMREVLIAAAPQPSVVKVSVQAHEVPESR